MASLSMLYNHAVVLKSPTPPALLRDRVERAVEVYPNNTAVMGIFLEAEKGQEIWGRVRATLGETAADGTGKTKGVARRPMHLTPLRPILSVNSRSKPNYSRAWMATSGL